MIDYYMLYSSEIKLSLEPPKHSLKINKNTISCYLHLPILFQKTLQFSTLNDCIIIFIINLCKERLTQSSAKNYRITRARSIISFACCKAREFDRGGSGTERLSNISSLTHETGYCDMQSMQHRVEAKRRDDSAVESRREGGVGGGWRVSSAWTIN